MEQTNSSAAIGCLATIGLIGSFASGVYMGHSEESGRSMNENLHTLLKYGPTVFGGILGIAAMNDLASTPRNVKELTDKVYYNSSPDFSRNDAENCVRGCALPFGAIFVTAAYTGATCVGYLLGKAMS
jgi:hypothetical protein